MKRPPKPLGPKDVKELCAGSELEARFAMQLIERNLLPVVRELRFHSTRQWRFDFAWPGRKIAVEVEGGTWSKGRHVRGSGFRKDCEKYNAATFLGWSVLRGDGAMVKSGELVDTLERMLYGDGEDF